MRALIGNCWSRIKIFADLQIGGNDKLGGKQTHDGTRRRLELTAILRHKERSRILINRVRNVLKFSQHLREIGAWTARSD